MKNTIIAFLLLFFLLIITAIPASAQFATLMWDENPEPDVAGYNVYYRSDTPSFPFNGTELPEGSSPIYVDGSTITTLEVNIPDDGKIYYFTATALNSSGTESGFSDIVASGWVPELLAPVENQTVTSDTLFTWDAAPVGYNVTYDLYYGTDAALDSNIAASISSIPLSGNRLQTSPFTIVTIGILLTLLPIISSAGKTKRRLRPVRIAVCIGIFALQAACGGGGSSTTSGSPPAINTTDPATPLFTNVVSDIASTQYQVTALEPGTRYYWKVVAVDNWGKTFESLTQSFTTN